MKTLPWFLQATVADIYHHLQVRLPKLGYEVELVSDQFLYAWPKESFEDDPAYVPMLVSHVDTVPRVEPVVLEFFGSTIRSKSGVLGADDRAGVFINYYLAHKLSRKIPLLFTNYEESGGKGATSFCSWAKEQGIEVDKDISLFVEFDRRGFNDLVTYEDAPKEVLDLFAEYGYDKKYGSYSDVATLSRTFKVAHVNLSCGFYSQHTANEFLLLEGVRFAIKNAVDFLPRLTTSQFKIIEKPAYAYKKYEYTDFQRKCTVCGRFKKWADLNWCSELRSYICDDCDKKTDKIAAKILPIIYENKHKGAVQCDWCLGFTSITKITSNNLEVCVECYEKLETMKKSGARFDEDGVYYGW